MKRNILKATVLLLAAASMPLRAQLPVEVTAAGFYESYSFDTGTGSLAFSRISELTVPVGVKVDLGRIGDVALSSGWANVKLTSANTAVLPNQTLSGILDTEARLSINVIPGRLMLITNGSVPTGVKTVEREELSILGALSSDIIGFANSQMGSGGFVGSGFAGAVPVGRFALGLGGTYRRPLSYVPINGETDELKPGAEFRFRAGIEGPVGSRGYLRFAGTFAMRSKDEVGGAVRNGVGNRIVSYLSLNQGIASSTLIVYGFNVFRSDPQIGSTATGAAILPRGNLTAAGFRWSFPLSRDMTIGPRAEFRYSLLANESNNSLEVAGRSLRFGVDLRRRVNRNFAIVLQGGGITGFVVDADTARNHVGFNGYRFALHSEITP